MVNEKNGLYRQLIHIGIIVRSFLKILTIFLEAHLVLEDTQRLIVIIVYIDPLTTQKHNTGLLMNGKSHTRLWTIHAPQEHLRGLQLRREILHI